MSRRAIAVWIAVAVALLFVLGRISGILIGWAWFTSVGYGRVFWTLFLARAAMFCTVFVATALILWVNAALALHFALPQPVRAAVRGGHRPTTVEALPGSPAAMLMPELPVRAWRLLALIVVLVASLLIALAEIGTWETALRFLYQVPYGQTDPQFGKDVGFYLFSLPAYVALNDWLLLVLVLAIAMAGAVYVLLGAISLDLRPRRIAAVAVAHGSALLGFCFALKAWSYMLDRYLLVYNNNGVVVGAAYTDTHIELPVLWVLIVLSAAAAVLAWANVRLRTHRLVIASVVLVFGTSFVFAEVLPGMFERFIVKPSELQLETPYLHRNIALTREAYNLNKITVKPFPAEQELTYQSLERNRGTVNNIRLWDWQPLLETYAQLQEIRTYYKFLEVDVDRYHLNGSYQQVMLAPREIAPSLLAPNAQTWVNLHLLFTHGNGVVMSPVTQKSSEGLPNFYLKDIPPLATGGPEITQPRIYFGQNMSGYVIVKTGTPEFDYPKGARNVYASYDGADGVPVGNEAWRSLFAWYFGDINILLSRYITSNSRIIIHRDIQDRVGTIAPFLQLDHDPYMVISGGKLYWMQDAYTTSDWFPYSQPQPGNGINYIRNSVKVVIDAYDGSITLYVADPTDPIIRTYQRIFPELFRPLSAMPPDLQQHVRYPEDMFYIQAQQYRDYHMTAPEVFYNREDLWQFPREPTAPGDIGADGRMRPYYVMMRLPEDPSAQFFLMLPMAPSRRENMIAWLAARCDPPGYGKLLVYAFPKDKLVYGPFQIEARVNQNTEISQQISLWNQMGSRVIRGNLLVVPIDNSLLYVSPLYLRAQSGQLPELKRVIAAYGDRVVMEDTLPEALAALFQRSVPPAVTLPPTTIALPAEEQGRAALSHYDKAIERLKAGDWAGFGVELNALRPLLQQLGGQPPPELRSPASAPPFTAGQAARSR